MTTLVTRDTTDIQKNILATYFTMRGGMVLLSGLFPIVLLGYSFRAHDWTLTECSISAFYGADDYAMRNYFVATLCVVGALLAIYKGFSLLENVLLKVAGGSVALVAFIPCGCWNECESNQLFAKGNQLHTSFAITFFACMALVVELCAFETITLLPTRLQNRFKRIYHGIAVGLILSPIAAVTVNYVARLPAKSIFFAEAFGVEVFAFYWFVKSREFHITAADKKAARGQLARARHGLVDLTAPPGPTTP